MELSRRVQFLRIEDGRAGPSEGGVVREALVRLHINGSELARLMCTPEQLDYLALGFLRGEGLIRELADVRLLVVCPSRTCVDVWLKDANVELPGQPVLTSGCGGGITFADLEAAGEPVRSGLHLRAGQIGLLMTELLVGQEARGIHRAGLADAEGLLAVAEDVGRHNTLDKVWGYCLKEGVETQDRILLTTGRIVGQYNSGSMTLRSPSLKEQDPELYVEMNPEDASRLGISDGEMVVVSTCRGEAEASARLTEKVRPGIAFMPFHYHGTNLITSDALDPISKIPEYKIAACRIEART